MKDSHDICPTLRQDLKIIRRYDRNGSLKYYIKCPTSENIFVLKEGEYSLCKQLDGHTSLHDIKSRFENHFNISLDIVQLKALIDQLGREGLLTEDKPKQISVLNLSKYMSPESWQRWKIIVPAKFFIKLAKTFRWCFTWPFFTAFVIIFLLAIGVLYNNFFEFSKDLKLYFFPLSIFKILIIYFVCFNIPSQIVRGITTIHYGGHVDEIGIYLFFDVIPLFYCTGRLWEIKKKSYRNLAIFASIYYVLLIASLGMLCWKMTSPALTLHTFGITIAVIGAINSIIKLNFLWPTDTSHLLSNWLEIADFRNRAINVFEAWLFLRPLPEPLTSGEKKLFIWYGLLTVTVTFSSLVIIIYFLGKELVDKLAGTGALVFFALVLVKYRKKILLLF